MFPASPLYAAAGLSHHLFPAGMFSPLCVLWLACAATGRVLGQRLATRGDLHQCSTSARHYLGPAPRAWEHPLMGFFAVE